jgi:hypothetical protein
MRKFFKSLLVSAALGVAAIGLGSTPALALGPGGVTSLDGGTGFFNTGVNSSGAALTGGSTDGNYSVLSPAGSAIVPTTTTGLTPFTDDTAYLTPSNWTAVNSSGAADPNASYTYQTTFTVPATGLDLSTISLFGQIAGNTGITSVSLNGNVVTLDPSAQAFGNPNDAGTNPHIADRIYLPSADFTTGTNTLTITVANNAGVTPSALRLEATVNALPTAGTLASLIPPGAVTFTNTGTGGLYNTGLNSTGSGLQTQGIGDAHWTITTNPDGITPGTAANVTEGSSFQFGPGGWVPNNTNSQWISPLATYGATPNTTQTDLPGDYTFQTTFDLTGLDPTTAILAGRIAADDHIVEIELNGVNTGFVPDDALEHSTYDHYDYFELTSGFISGINTLDFILSNNDNSAVTGSNVGNPVGMQVQLVGVADPAAVTSPVPLPAAVALFPAGLAVAGFCKRRLGRKA